MSHKNWLSLVLLGLFIMAEPTFADEAPIAIDDLPKAVLKAAKAQFPGAKIRGASKEVEDGETMYEVEMTVDGKNVDLLIEPNGEIEAIEKEIEIEDLPRAVLKAARARFPKGKIEKAEEITSEDDKVVYELSIVTKGEETVELVIVPNGKILENEDEEKDEKEAKKQEKNDDKKQEKTKPKS